MLRGGCYLRCNKMLDHAFQQKMKTALMRSFGLIFLVAVIINGCKKVDNNVPLIKGARLVLSAPGVVSPDGPLVSCTSSLDLSSGGYTYGFCYGLTPDPVIPGTNTVAFNYSGGEFSALLSNISFGKMYYVRGFITNGFATAYSNMDSFFIPLYLQTDTVRNITARSFDITVYTSPAAADSITERGVCYDTLQMPGINSLKTVSTVTDTGNILVQVNDTLLPGKTYYLRSYFIANGRPVYGNQVSFRSAGYAGSYGYIIFDKGTTTGGWRYIEAAGDSITTNSITWGCPGTNVPGTALAIGAGLQNSDTIVATCNDTLAAANICLNLALKAKTDWYLPSVDELKALYELKLSGVITRNPVLFSSTQASAADCYVVDLSSGLETTLPKSSAEAWIWPVRRY